MPNDVIAVLVLILIGLVIYMQRTGSSLRDIVLQFRDAFRR
jgi:hypothetical protein